MRIFTLLLFLILFSSIASAEVLVLNINKGEYAVGESAKVYGYSLDNSLNALANTSPSIIP